MTYLIEVVTSIPCLIEVITSMTHLIEVVTSMHCPIEVITSINTLTSIRHIYMLASNLGFRPILDSPPPSPGQSQTGRNPRSDANIYI